MTGSHVLTKVVELLSYGKLSRAEQKPQNNLTPFPSESSLLLLNLISTHWYLFNTDGRLNKNVAQNTYTYLSVAIGNRLKVFGKGKS